MDTEMLLKQIGARISARRRELNITQEQLAEKMDVSIQMIPNLEGGKKSHSPRKSYKTLLGTRRKRRLYSSRNACGLRER